ncbi:hypothetical protein HK098_001035 [Nowakowskiella sp. JEL0407]|nr:hypothetical protein HK098_001035 [Nowakowskiella sp. JEL0407]
MQDFPSEIIQNIVLYLPLNAITNLTHSNAHFFKSIRLDSSIILNALLPFTSTPPKSKLYEESGHALISHILILSPRCPPAAISKAWQTLGILLCNDIDADLQISSFVTRHIVQNANLDLEGSRNELFRGAARAGNWVIIDSLLSIAETRGLNQQQTVQYAMGYATLYKHIDVAERLFMQVFDKGYPPRPVLALAMKNAASTGDEKMLKLVFSWAEKMDKVQEMPVEAAIQLAKNNRHNDIVWLLRWFDISRTVTYFGKALHVI